MNQQATGADDSLPAGMRMPPIDDLLETTKLPSVHPGQVELDDLDPDALITESQPVFAEPVIPRPPPLPAPPPSKERSTSGVVTTTKRDDVAVERSGSRASSGSWDVKPGRWWTSLPAMVRGKAKVAGEPVVPEVYGKRWTRRKVGLASGIAGVALVAICLFVGFVGLASNTYPTSRELAIALVAGRVVVAVVGVAFGRALLLLGERLLVADGWLDPRSGR